MTDTERPTAYLLVGLPGSGKTTWARTHLDQRAALGRRGSLVRLSRDDMRAMLLDRGYTARGPDDPPLTYAQETEDTVTAIRTAMLATVLWRGLDLIMDETNLIPERLKKLVWSVTACHADYRIVDFTGVPLHKCIDQDMNRDYHERVGGRVIRRMYQEYLYPLQTYSLADLDGIDPTKVVTP